MVIIWVSSRQGGAICTTLTKTPSTSELPSLKVLTPSTRSKVSHMLDNNPERHKAALKILSMHFTREELANSNCSGVYDKKQLNPKRLAVVKRKPGYALLQVLHFVTSRRFCSCSSYYIFDLFIHAQKVNSQLNCFQWQSTFILQWWYLRLLFINTIFGTQRELFS